MAPTQPLITSSYPRSKRATFVTAATPLSKKFDNLTCRSTRQSSRKRRSPTDEEKNQSENRRPVRKNTAQSLFTEDNDDEEKRLPSPTKQKKVDRFAQSTDSPAIKVKATPKKGKQQDIISPYERAKLMLNASFVDEFVHRDEELQKINLCLHGHLTKKKALGLYISGAPGTGKTLCVTHVLNKLQKKHDFTLVTINCMDCRNPSHIYSKIVSGCGCEEEKTPKANLEFITDEIATPAKKKKIKFTVVLLDEIDKLENKSQDVLYTLFDYPRIDDSRFILIGIANTLDLTVRTLTRYKALNLDDIKEIHFQPYTRPQVKGIIEARLQQVADETNNIFSGLAIELCSRKVAMHSVDVRKALQVCRRAIEVAECDAKASRVLANDDVHNTPRKNSAALVKVSISHIQKVLNEVYGSQLNNSDQKIVLPTKQQLILCTLLISMKKYKRSEVEVPKCHELFSRICQKKAISFDIGNSSEFLSMCQLLETKGLLAVKICKGVSKLSMTVNERDVEDIMADKNLFKTILHDKSFLN